MSKTVLMGCLLGLSVSLNASELQKIDYLDIAIELLGLVREYESTRALKERYFRRLEFFERSPEHAEQYPSCDDSWIAQCRAERHEIVIGGMLSEWAEQLVKESKIEARFKELQGSLTPEQATLIKNEIGQVLPHANDEEQNDALDEHNNNLAALQREFEERTREVALAQREYDVINRELQLELKAQEERDRVIELLVQSGADLATS